MESYSQLLRADFLTARCETWSSGCSGTRGGGGGGCGGAAGGGAGDAAPRPEFEPDDDARRARVGGGDGRRWRQRLGGGGVEVGCGDRARCQFPSLWKDRIQKI